MSEWESFFSNFQKGIESEHKDCYGTVRKTEETLTDQNLTISSKFQ